MIVLEKNSFFLASWLRIHGSVLAEPLSLGICSAEWMLLLSLSGTGAASYPLSPPPPPPGHVTRQWLLKEEINHFSLCQFPPETDDQRTYTFETRHCNCPVSLVKTFQDWEFIRLLQFSPLFLNCHSLSCLICLQKAVSLPNTGPYVMMLMWEVRFHCSLWHYPLSLSRSLSLSLSLAVFLPLCLCPLGAVWWDSRGREP